MRKELKNLFEEKLNCTPPLIASETDQVCNKKFNLSRDKSREIFVLFWNNYFNFEPLRCRKPCTQTRYEVHEETKADVEDFVIKLIFEPGVFVYFCICVFVYLCICIFVFERLCDQTNL